MRYPKNYLPATPCPKCPFLQSEYSAMTDIEPFLQPRRWYLRLLLSNRFCQRQSRLPSHSCWMLWERPLEVVIKVRVLQAQRPQCLLKLLHHQKGPQMKFLVLNLMLFSACPFQISCRKPMVCNPSTITKDISLGSPDLIVDQTCWVSSVKDLWENMEKECTA